MSARGIGDAFAFQRLLWLLIGTVVIPTLVLALYGFTAIRNQRAVFIERERAVHAELLQDAARMVFANIDGVENGLRRRIERCPTMQTETCLVGEGVAEGWIWPMNDDPPRPVSQLVEPKNLGGDVRWFAPVDDLAPLGAFTLEGSVVAFRLDVSWLQERLQAAFARPLQLKQIRAGPAASMEEMVEWWQNPGVETVLPLARPLSQWRLSITSVDAVATGFLGGTAWLYSMGLVALVLTVLAGTGLALRSAQREFHLSRLQTDFVSSVSHEMRTPLTSIRMFVETLQSGKITDPEKTGECLDLLAQETDRLSRRIERVLNWASMEAGRRVYEPEECSAHDLMVRAAQAIRAHHLFSDELGTLAVEEPKVDLTVIADRDAVVEALLNLLQNAIRYTPTPRDIRLHLRTKGKLVGFGVEDNGPGIPLSERMRIFEKFYRVNPLLSAPRSEGSGLGLAIVRVIARDQGGSVELATEVGKGSCFTIWLPSA
jgi:signal transduction histidine kinase